MNSQSAARHIDRSHDATPGGKRPHSFFRAEDSMFQSHFQLQRRPFATHPSPDNYFPAESIESARSSIVRLIEREEGPGFVVGPAGIGKTLLRQMTAESFRHFCRVVQLPGGRLGSRRSLFQVILHDLGLAFRDLDEGELRLALIDHITNPDRCVNGILLLADEADSIALPVLDEIRTLLDLCVAGRPCVRAILFGTSRLEEKFAHPRLESFNQRLAGRFYLSEFSKSETERYVTQQLQDCGGTPSAIMNPTAFSAIHQATGGIPRLINQLCDHALVLAAVNGDSQLTSRTVGEAWANLQQLPLPAPHQESIVKDDRHEGIIEFGQLGDESATPGEHNAPSEEDQDHIAQSILEFTPAITPVEDRTDDTEIDVETSHLPEVDDSEDVEFTMPEPEVTTAHDPFCELFEEEEEIVDHYVSADAMAQRHRRQVTCAESFLIAGQLDTALESSFRSASSHPVQLIDVDEDLIVGMATDDDQDAAEEDDLTSSEDAVCARIDLRHIGTSFVAITSEPDAQLQMSPEDKWVGRTIGSTKMMRDAIQEEVNRFSAMKPLPVDCDDSEDIGESQPQASAPPKPNLRTLFSRIRGGDR